MILSVYTHGKTHVTRVVLYDDVLEKVVKAWEYPGLGSNVVSFYETLRDVLPQVGSLLEGSDQPLTLETTNLTYHNQLWMGKPPYKQSQLFWKVLAEGFDVLPQRVTLRHNPNTIARRAKDIDFHSFSQSAVQTVNLLEAFDDLC